MSTYREHLLEGSSAVDLVVALYDGIIRFLYTAADAVDRGDVQARRAAVKRAFDIIIHLQARLRMDIGGSPAQALSEFYASIFAQILQASQSASREKFEHVIECVRNVRDAWRQVANESAFSGEVRSQSSSAIHAINDEAEHAHITSWTA
ncbi:MAG TPA: flagellar export chaperone FliS [Terracidiphilus sp.]|nr:flagellar export chaperone FliS [Terracidiphilus sp.]